MGDTQLSAKSAKHHFAVLSIFALMLYFAIDNHITLYPWNNLEPAGSQLNSTMIGLIPFSFLIVAIFLRFRIGVLIGFLWALIWFLLQLRQWWLPYLFGATALHGDFTWYFSNGYADTFTVLPKEAERPTPDAQHMVLQLLSLIVIISLSRILWPSQK